MTWPCRGGAMASLVVRCLLTLLCVSWPRCSSAFNSGICWELREALPWRCHSRSRGPRMQVFPQDVSELLVETGFDSERLQKIGEKLRTPASTCLRVNTLRADVDQVAEELEQHCISSCGFRPTILRHPVLPECLIMPPRFNADFAQRVGGDMAQDSISERVVLVGRLCGEAVLQGADVFAPGVAAVPADLREGEAVSVYADITDCVQRGAVTAGRKPKPTDIVVTADTAVLVGRGVARMERGRIFGNKPVGVAVVMTERQWDTPSLSGWKDDVCMLQSLPAAVVAHVVDPQPGERVLDMCGAPGGKSTHLAQLMGDRGHVVACDRTKNKVERIRHLSQRLGLTCVLPTKADATCCVDKGVFEAASFDRVLLDPPCSALGLRPSLRVGGVSAWSAAKARRTDAGDLRSLPSYQRRMIHQAHAALRPGGRLVFSTCTLNPLENEGNVAWARDKFGLQLESQDAVRVGGHGMAVQGLNEDDVRRVQRFSPGEDEVATADPTSGELQALPGDCFTGFFIASFRKPR